MNATQSNMYLEGLSILADGGWLMLPLFFLALFMYFTALELYLRLRLHFLLKSKVYRLSDDALSKELSRENSVLNRILLMQPKSVEVVRRHFQEVRQEYLPVINRRIRFLAIVITTGPLVGLLGTVTGMLATFRGMVSQSGTKFDNMIEGISEALVTTQTGLLVSIPALVVLSFIIQHRNQLERCIARLEYYNITLAIR
ncbi:MAG: MotA/TolQ/ExbB proton channel family protein [Verrucomicrobiota bacterium]